MDHKPKKAFNNINLRLVNSIVKEEASYSNSSLLKVKQNASFSVRASIIVMKVFMQKHYIWYSYCHLKIWDC